MNSSPFDSFEKVSLSDLRGSHRVFFNAEHIMDCDAILTDAIRTTGSKIKKGAHLRALDFRFFERAPLPCKHANGSLVKKAGAVVMDTPPEPPTKKNVGVEKWGAPYHR